MDGFQTHSSASTKQIAAVPAYSVCGRSGDLRRWKASPMQEASPAFFASYLIRIASHHFNKMIKSSP